MPQEPPMTIIPRIEQATAEQVRELLEEAWNTIARGRGLPWAEANARRFTAMLDAEAWTSAAELLMPEGWHWTVNDFGDKVSAYLINKRNRMVRARQFQALPALALAAACLRASLPTAPEQGRE